MTQQMERMVQEQNKKEEEKKREAVRQKEEIAAAKEVGRRFSFVDVCLLCRKKSNTHKGMDGRSRTKHARTTSAPRKCTHC